MPAPEVPLVSCLMVTRPVEDRLAVLGRSIEDYLRQTHPRRELVIVVDGRDRAETTPEIRRRIARLGRDDIRIVEPGDTSLGALRNVSLAEARGDVVCIWDDDDRYHPERIERQLAALADSDGEAVCLQHAAHYFAAERRLYVTNWVKTEAHGLPGSLLCRRDAPVTYSAAGHLADLSEDMAPIAQLLARGGMRLLADQPHLYVYVWHGRNSHTEVHHRRLISELGLSRGLLQRHEAELRAGLAAFDFGRLTVEGTNGPAFTLG